MLTFKNGTLYCRKIEAPTIPISAIMDIQESYTKYVTETIYADIEYLQGLLRKVSGLQNVTLKAIVEDITEHGVPTITTVGTNRFIPVLVEFYLPGSSDPVKLATEIVRIPAMHDFGKFNFEGNLKVIVSQLRATDSVSYDSRKRTLNITMPKVNLRVRIYSNQIAFVVKNKRQPLFPVLLTMLADAGDATPIQEYIRSATTRTLLGYKDGMITDHYVESTRMHGGIYKSLQNDAYTLGEARNALNTTLTLERGIGLTLAENYEEFPRGYVVDNAFIKAMYAARRNQYVVRNKSFAGGYYYAGTDPIVLTFIPEGMKNTSYLRQLLPEYRSHTHFPENVKLEHPIIISKWHLLTADEMELIYSCGRTQIPVSVRKSGAVFAYSFVHEIIGNYTARMSTLTDTIPDDRSADEWVYYYNNENLEDSSELLKKLTAHDLLAIVSMLGEVSTTGNTDLLNRDTSFLKRVAMVNELFSESLRATMREHVQMTKNRIATYVTGNAASFDNVNPFIGLTKSWYRHMSKNKITATIDAMNLSAEIAQACHITTPDNGSGEIIDEQRDIAVPYYGRLCPFETPAGFKLGTVNTRALGSKIEDGILYTPYRRVMRAGNSIRISNKVTWLSPSDEFGHKFASALSLKQRPDGTYENNKILARVPNVEQSDEPFTFKNIHAYELAGHYVDAFPEQTISPATALVPFACCNNPIRLSYGISQIKQGVLLHNSQRPKVHTPMSTQLFDFYSSCDYFAPCDGTVTSIVLDQYVIVESSIDGKSHKVITANINQSPSRPMVPTYYVKEGDTVTNGQLLCRGVLYPTDFVVRSPMDGYVTHITRTSIEIMKTNAASIPGMPVDIREEEPVIIPLNTFRKLGTNAVFLNIHCHVGQQVKAGDILADTYTSRGGIYSPARCPLVAFVPTGYNYEDGVHGTERASVAYTSMLATTLKHRESKGKSTSMNLGIPADFKYYRAGDNITDVVKHYSDKQSTRKASVVATTKSHGFYYEGHMADNSSNAWREYALSLLSFNKLQKGDKMSGMHGNKGTISYVQPDSEVLQLSNGRTCEILLSPCGVPSRMNYGQMLEMPMSLVAEVLNIEIDTAAYNGASLEEVATLMKFTYAMCNETDSVNDIPSTVQKFGIIPIDLIPHLTENWEHIKDWEGVFDEYGCAPLYDPTIDEWLVGKAVIGFPTFNKLMQEAEEKLTVRAGIMEEEYARTTSQPIGNIVSAKGQRVGEMELVNIANYGMAEFLREVLNEASDNPNARANVLFDTLSDKDVKRFDESICASRAVTNLIHLLRGVNVAIDLDPEVVAIDPYKSSSYEELNLPKYLHNKYSGVQRNEWASMKGQFDFGDLDDE